MWLYYKDKEWWFKKWGEGIGLISALLEDTLAKLCQLWSSTRSRIPAKLPPDHGALSDCMVLLRRPAGHQAPPFLCLRNCSVNDSPKKKLYNSVTIILSSHLIYPNNFLLLLYIIFLNVKIQLMLQVVDSLAFWEVMIQIEETDCCFLPLTRRRQDRSLVRASVAAPLSQSPERGHCHTLAYLPFEIFPKC